LARGKPEKHEKVGEASIRSRAPQKMGDRNLALRNKFKRKMFL